MMLALVMTDVSGVGDIISFLSILKQSLFPLVALEDDVYWFIANIQ